jgi:hypothetical protein
LDFTGYWKVLPLIRILDMYQPASNSKVIHIHFVDKSSFNPFLILGFYVQNRKYTKIVRGCLRLMD